VELRFAAPDLSRLDLAASEVLALALIEGERPPQAVAGLVDWRLAGRLSRLIQSGFVKGQLGEVLLLPGRPKLPFDKIVLFGAGTAQGFNEAVFQSVMQKMLATLEGLRVRNAVVELPGRHLSKIAPERAARILLEATADRAHHDIWTLLESPEAERSITKHMAQERRRAQSSGS
jgi:hypothetical protein